MDKIKQQFARYLRQSERSPLTIKNYLSDIDGFGKWFLKANGDTLTPERVTPIDLREYKRFLVEERRLKPQSTNRKLIALSCFLKWCYHLVFVGPQDCPDPNEVCCGFWLDDLGTQVCHQECMHWQLCQ